MSTDVKTLNAELDKMVSEGQLLDAFEKFYADDVVMQENSDEPRKGKDANREYEKKFVGSVETVHGIHLLSSAVEGGAAFSEWVFDVTFKGGQRTKLEQAAVRRWKDGKVVHERFYFNKG
jgi:ketosteroid isomerase-like protein